MAKTKSTGGCGTFFILLAIIYAIAQFIEENYITICIILGIVILLILIYTFSKRKEKHKVAPISTNKPQASKSVTNYPSDSQLNYANSLLKRSRHLADILNTTIDREEFYISFDELNSVLKSLSELEGQIKFSGTLPSVKLKEINADKQASIDFLERRIKESQNGSGVIPDSIQQYQPKESQILDNLDIRPKTAHKNELEVDPYFTEAGKFVIEKNMASTGMLQRLLKIGFNRAAKIMDQLYNIGVIGPEEGTSPRKVLMSMKQFEDFLNNTELIEIVPNEYKSTNSISQYTLSSKLDTDRIQMYNGKYDYMDGHDFEQFCARLLEANGFSNVHVTPESNDQGIDILAEKQKVKYAIQCKRYSSDVGNKAVQEAFAGKSYYNCHVGVVLTNRYFTQSAKDLSEKTQVFLWDRDTLNALCENYYQKELS